MSEPPPAPVHAMLTQKNKQEHSCASFLALFCAYIHIKYCPL